MLDAAHAAPGRLTLVTVPGSIAHRVLVITGITPRIPLAPDR